MLLTGTRSESVCICAFVQMFMNELKHKPAHRLPPIGRVFLEFPVCGYRQIDRQPLRLFFRQRRHDYGLVRMLMCAALAKALRRV